MEATPVLDDPLTPIYVAGVTRLIAIGGTWPIVLVIDNTWVSYHGNDQWLIGPDEPATAEQVRELMVQSGGIFELLDY